MKKTSELRENLLRDGKQNNRISLRRPESTSHASSLSASAAGSQRKKKNVTLTDAEREILQSERKTSAASSLAPHMSTPSSLSPLPSSSYASPNTFGNGSGSDIYQNSYSDPQALRERNLKVTTTPENSMERERHFRDVEQYGWDFVFILPNPDIGSGDNNSGSPNKSNVNDGKVSHAQLAAILRRGGLQSYSYYSSTSEYIIVKIRAGVSRLEQQAELMGYKLLLDDKKLRTAANRGVRYEDARKGYRIKPIHINEDRAYSRLKPYGFIYAPYSRDASRNIRELVYKPKGMNHPFISTHRIELILAILEDTGSSGCGLDLDDLRENGSVYTYFPLRDVNVCERELPPAWLPWRVKSWKQPIDDIRDYFGAKIGLYFKFLGHYTTCLLYLGLAGLIVCIDVAGESADLGLAYGLGNAKLIPFYGLFSALWAQVFLEYWKRAEAYQAMAWGMAEFEDTQADRPSFDGYEIQSYVTGKNITYFPSNEKIRRTRWSTFVITCFMLVVIGIVALLFYIKITMNNNGLEDYAGIVVPVANAVQVAVLNDVYVKYAQNLNSYENHRTQVEFEDALILKLFAFHFVNSYSALIYIAFIKENMGDACLYTCMAELSQTLITILFTQLIIGNIQESLIPKITEMYNRRMERSKALAHRHGDNNNIKESKMSSAEEEMSKEEYDRIDGLLMDYSELSIRYGFISLFVCSCPIAPMIEYVSNVVEIRVDARKLLYDYRRPIPQGNQDIGTWMDVFVALSFLSVITNSGIVCFTMDVFPSEMKVWLFITFQYVIFSGMYIFEMIIDDVPEEVSIQTARQEFLLRKVVDQDSDSDNDQSDDEEDSNIGGTISMNQIFHFDDTVKL